MSPRAQIATISFLVQPKRLKGSNRRHLSRHDSRGDWPGWPDPELLRLAAIGQNRRSSCTFAVIPTLATTSGVGRYLYGQGSSADYTVDRRVSNMNLANGGSREIRKKLISLSVYITQNDFFWHIPSGRH